MPTPLEQSLLTRSGSIGPATPDQVAENAQSLMPMWKQGLQSGLNGGIDAIKGLAGFGSGETKANAGGQIVGAIAPVGAGVVDGKGIIKEILELIRGSEAPNPAKTFLNEKVGGFMIPHRSMVAPPDGFEFPQEMGTPWLSRDPNLADAYVTQKNSIPPKPNQQINYSKPQAAEPYGGSGSNIAKVLNRSTNKANPDMVRAIRALQSEGKTLQEINQTYPLKPMTLRDILSGSSWSSIK